MTTGVSAMWNTIPTIIPRSPSCRCSQCRSSIRPFRWSASSRHCLLPCSTLPATRPSAVESIGTVEPCHGLGQIFEQQVLRLELLGRAGLDCDREEQRALEQCQEARLPHGLDAMAEPDRHLTGSRFPRTECDMDRLPLA